MTYEFKLADIGEGIHEAEILQWHVQVGDNIKEDQVLVEVHTEKVNTEITSPVAGVITSLEHQEGDILQVGQILLKIETSKTSSQTSTDSPTPEPTTQTDEKDDSLFKPDKPLKHIPLKQDKASGTERPVLAAPAIRRRARAVGINLHDVKGSGPASRITQRDLDAYLTAKKETTPVDFFKKAPISETEERIPIRGIRRVVAQTMRKSKDTAAHYSYFDEVDMTALDELRKLAKPLAEQKNIRLSYLPLVIKCLIPALKQFPLMNASLDDEKEEIVIKNYYNIGIAVDTSDGLIVPVIKNADQKTIWELAAEIADLASRAREGKLKLAEVTGGSFTITSVGNLGGMMATPIIRWPEVAILGLMRAKMRPVAVEIDGKYDVVVKRVMYLSVTLDHRVIDGAIGARFGNVLIHYLENPSLILLAD